MKLFKLLKLVFFVLLFSITITSHGQETDKLIVPTTTFTELSNNIENYKCETFDIDQKIADYKDDVANGVSPLIFAKKFDVALTPDNSGEWEEKEGLMIWRLRNMSFIADLMADAEITTGILVSSALLP